MKRTTRDWVRKAENDRRVARREMGCRRPVWEAVCFHAQQCAEKYLKAFLDEHDIAFQKNHDLVTLFDACGRALPEIADRRKDMARLSTFGIAVRYPGTDVDRTAARSSLETAEVIR